MNAADSLTGYPLRVEGTLDRPPSRGLWLVKWLLAIPRFVIVFFLWIALLATTVVAWLAIRSFTGRYARSLFDPNVTAALGGPFARCLISAALAPRTHTLR
jgi:hypothetical protein